MSRDRSMRVIAGRWRSRVLACPAGGQTRPMPDRVKEAVFDILGSRLASPGFLPPLVVGDLFAGSGALGLEALSRGARSCYFLEMNVRVLRILRANVEAVGAGAVSQVVATDVWRDGLACVAVDHLVGLLLLDPPYRDARDSSAGGRVCHLLQRASTSGRLGQEAIAVVHHERRIVYPAVATPGWECVERREYGTHGLTFYRWNASTASVPCAENGVCQR